MCSFVGFVCCPILLLSVYLFYQKLTENIARVRSAVAAFVAILFEHIFRTLATVACTMFRNITIVSRLTANKASFTKLQRETKRQHDYNNEKEEKQLHHFCNFMRILLNFSCKFRIKFIRSTNLKRPKCDWCKKLDKMFFFFNGKTYFAIITAQTSRTLGFRLQFTSNAITTWIVFAFFTCAAIAFFVLLNDLVTAISTLDFQLPKQQKKTIPMQTIIF